MTENLPDYSTVKVPAGTPPEEYTHHQRRADILRVIYAAGDPGAIKQVRLADRYGVHESTISRDMDRIRESVGEHMGREAKLETEAQAKKTIDELQEQGRWYKAWQIRESLNEFLFDTGHLDREPQRSELDVDVDSRHAEVAYTVVREGDDEPLPTDADGDGDGASVDYEDLGFTSAPAEIPIEDGLSDEQPRGGADE